MSRPIKFRAWDGKTMIPYEDMLLYDGQIVSSFVMGLRDPKMIYMQFTDLKDKNGTEIYEGDVVKVDIPNYINDYIEAEVEFSGGCFGIRVIGNPILNNTVGQFKAFNENTKGVEIIGNIYENPELLEDNPNDLK